MRAVLLAISIALGCSSVPNQDVHVIRSESNVPESCDLVGSIPIGMSHPDSDRRSGALDSITDPTSLEQKLLRTARSTARDWDASLLVFETVVEKRPASAATPGLWCRCKAYRCADNSSEQPIRVPLVALVANPEEYEGRLVNVTAWAALEYELAAVFLSSEDKEHLAFENGVRLDGPESLFSDIDWPFYGYLEVEGRFSRSQTLPIFAGKIAVHRVWQARRYPPH